MATAKRPAPNEEPAKVVAKREPLDRLPEVRDGLTRVERVILWQLSLLEKERPGRNIPTAQLYGRVVEHVDISVDELQRTLGRLGARKG